ncbi:uncharacterized protein LOC105663387 [Megachile rotundata]|uniref:uncharacterized protein LOC105663387 n=1 Tax=Megachile rotundata TaxID=143995 RepID=UPI003FD06C69
MSETEDIRATAESNDFHSIIEGESGRSSSVDYLDTYEDIPKETAKFGEEGKIQENKEETFAEIERKSSELEKREVTRPAIEIAKNIDLGGTLDRIVSSFNEERAKLDSTKSLNKTKLCQR